MKRLMMMTMMMVSVMTGGGSAALAGSKSCTDQPKEKWMTQEAFKKSKEAEGFKIRKFKQPGTCYEIYGTDKAGHDVEIYFNPVDGSVVRKK